MTSASKIIKKVLEDRNLKVKDLAEKMNKEAQYVRNKLYRDNFSYNEYIEIMRLLDCDVKTIVTNTSNEYLNTEE